MNREKVNPGYSGLETAVIGMAGRFPGCGDLDTFWHNLQQGIESVSFFSNQELLKSGMDKELLENPAYVKSRQNIEGKEYFDSFFFGYLPEEARLIDPQVRLFHQCAWAALEDAGIDPDAYEGLIGLYAGAGSSFDWEAYVIMSGFGRGIDPFTAGQLMSRDYISAWVSYKLNLKGPTVFVHTTCSTSLVAIHMACRALLTGEAHIALAGGVTLSTSSNPGYLYQEGMIYSPDGHCRVFDAKSRGTVGGEGAGVVVLKQLKHALAERDHIWAVVKGSAVNNDGFRKVGFSAPSADGQAEVIRMALKMSRIEPQSITCIEAHGTGTPLGDPIELSALHLVFGTSSEKYCALGSVKSNFGHLDTAAGAAGFIKTVLALKHRQIPPSLHFETPNPRIDFENSPFYVNTELREWTNGRFPLRAGVNSFGIGGTNAHVILEEAPLIESSPETRANQLMVFSARSPAALDRMISNFKDFLVKNKDVNTADAAYTLQTGRKSFSHRCMWVCRDVREAVEILSAPDLDRIRRHASSKKRGAVFFMFSGQGTQYVNMGLDLYRMEKVFRQEMDRCFDIFESLMGYDLKEVLYPGSADPTEGSPASRALDRPCHCQPALFFFEYALARMLLAWGIKPAAMIGYSIGEYAAACLAGVFSLADAVKLVAHRGVLMEQLPAGAMLSVPLPEEELLPLIEGSDELSLAVINGPSCIISGTPQAVADFEKGMKKRKIFCMRLSITQAGHSKAMEPILEKFAGLMAGISLSRPRVPYISTVTGDWLRDEEAVAAGYWSGHIRAAVRFAAGVSRLLEKEDGLFLEIGPGKALSGFVRSQQDKKPDHRVLNLTRDKNEAVSDLFHLLDRVGRLWLYGLEIDWQQFYLEEKRQKISLPSYPFEKIKYPVYTDAFKMLSLLEKGEQKKGVHLPGEQEGSIPAQDIRLAGERPGLVTPYVEPTTESERVLAGIWQAFFCVGKIGISDDFFELGGDSLKGMALLARLHKELNLKISLETFFKFPNIRQLAAYLARDGHDTLDKYETIEPIEKREYYVLSPGQKRTYILHQLDAGKTAYNEPQVGPLPGILDKKGLEEALLRLIRKHESLRTSFVMVAEEPVQRVHAPEEIVVTIEYHEADHGTGPTLDRIIENFIRPFDLSRPPLLRMGVVKSRGGQTLLTDIHHIVTDGTSMQLLRKDFMDLYLGESPAVLRIQYKDYTQWLNRPEIKESVHRQEEYWKSQFDGDIPVLNLPQDYPRPAVQDFAGHTVKFFFTEEQTRQLRNTAAGQGATLYMVLLSVFNILLARLCQQEDIVVGSPIVGRRHADLQPIIGMFVNTLALRNYPKSQKSFEEFLQDVKETTLNAYENQEYPFEDLVEKVSVNRDLSRNPLFDVMFALQNQAEMRQQTSRGGGEEGSAFGGSRHTTAKFDLGLYSIEVGERLDFMLEYCTRLFKEGTIKRFVKYFKQVVSAVTANPRQRIADLDIIDEPERKEILAMSLGPAGGFDVDSTLPRLFAEQAEKTPDRAALLGPLLGSRVGRIQSMTYRELNQRSTQLARLLIEKGVERDSIVGLMAGRCCEMIVAILGILKAGGAYLPISPDYPQERIAYMLSDSGAEILLTSRDLADKFQEGDGIKTCPPIDLIDECGLERRTLSHLRLPPATALAYIIYTSGSSGDPRGAAITHANLSPLLHWGHRHLQLGPQERVIQNLAYFFDWSVWEIFLTLMCGASLHMITEDILLDPGSMIEFIERNEITVLHVTPSQYHYLLYVGKKLKTLKHLFIGAEKLSHELVRRSMAAVNEDCRVYNMYGPTEATIISAVFEIDRAGLDRYRDSSSVPIGRPVGNTQLFILDRNLRLCPMQVTGELYIAGHGISSGYLNRPELTSWRFISVPARSIRHDPCPRHLYKTGDLCRWLPDGNIEFLGRLDFQVKIRGFRIELGEIEAHVLKHPAVEEAVVTARQNQGGDTYLCAYVLTKGRRQPGSDAPAPEELREFLSRSLPPYMIPTSLVFIDKIPLNPNGKVDLKALPEPGIKSEERYVAPRNEVEKALVEIWAEVLGIEKGIIGIDANFFLLGGHSLKATILKAKIQNRFAVDFSLAELFKIPNIRGISSLIRTVRWAGNQGKPDTYQEMEELIL